MYLSLSRQVRFKTAFAKSSDDHCDNDDDGDDNDDNKTIGDEGITVDFWII